MSKPDVLKVASLGQALFAATVLILQIIDLLKSKAVQPDVGSPASS